MLPQRSPQQALLIRGARQLITMNGYPGLRRGAAMNEIGAIEDGAVLIVNGQIVSVGQSRRVENLATARSAEAIDVAGRVIVPGFVDAHTWLVSPPPRFLSGRMRNPIDFDAAYTTSAEYVRATAPGTIETHARRNLNAALRHGTTTLELKIGYGVAPGLEAKTFRVAAALLQDAPAVMPTLPGAWILPPDSKDATTYLEALTKDVLPKARERKAFQAVEVFCDPKGFSPDQLRPCLQAAVNLGFRVRVHGDVTDRSGAASLAVESGAVCATGLNCVEDRDIETLAHSSVVSTVVPYLPAQRNAGMALPPARLLIDSGAAVALATGFDPGTYSTYNMQTAMALACTQLEMSPEEALTAATWNAAHALGIGTQCGALLSGRSADLAILSISDYRDLPLHPGGNLVSSVLRGGQIVYREGAVEWATA